MISTKKCLICNNGQRNDVLYWHLDEKTGDIWCWCNKCNRGYSLRSYCWHAGIDVNEFLKGQFDIRESSPNEVNKIEFPPWYVTLSDPRAERGVEYIRSRGLLVEGDMYYDVSREGIVFPYYYENTFVGAQVRFIEPKTLENGTLHKIETLPGTRLGLVFYGWNQDQFVTDIKNIVVTEGAFDAIAIQQALVRVYGGVADCPWRSIACSGAGATRHHKDTLRELRERGYNIILAPDSDDAGISMLERFNESEAITHSALTGDEDRDWNDFLKELGHKEFARWFLSKIKRLR